MNILLLCNKSPYPPSEGGPMAMNSIVTGLLEAGHKVKIMALNSNKYHVDLKSIPQQYRDKTRIEFVDVDLSLSIKEAFKNLFSDESYHVKRFISQQFKDRLAEVLDKEKFDIVQLEMIYMAPYIETIREHSNAVIVLRAHNVEHQIWSRIAKKTVFFAKRWYINHLVRTLKKFEMEVINKVDGIAAITPDDALFFRRVTSTPVIDLPFGIDISKFDPSFEVGDTPTFYHIGSMDWMPNQEGIKWLLNNVWGEVLKRQPEAKLYLAGRNMPKWLRNTKKKNVFVVGEVTDAHEFVNQNNIAIVPLFSGSGMRIKIIESMALGKAVITTTVGAEGIQYSEFDDIIIADNTPKMIENICRLYKHPEEAEAIGLNARRLVEELYDNHKIINRLGIFYKELTTKRKITILD